MSKLDALPLVEVSDVHDLPYDLSLFFSLVETKELRPLSRLLH